MPLTKKSMGQDMYPVGDPGREDKGEGQLGDQHNGLEDLLRGHQGPQDQKEPVCEGAAHQRLQHGPEDLSPEFAHQRPRDEDQEVPQDFPHRKHLEAQEEKGEAVCKHVQVAKEKE